MLAPNSDATDWYLSDKNPPFIPGKVCHNHRHSLLCKNLSFICARSVWSYKDTEYGIIFLPCTGVTMLIFEAQPRPCSLYLILISLFLGSYIFCLNSVFENAEKIILVMEFASGGELYDYINDKQGLYEEEARKFFRQIVSAVHYLHMVRVCRYNFSWYWGMYL